MPGTPKYPKDQGTEWMNLKTQVKNAFTSANSRVPYQKITAGILRVASSLEIMAGAFIKFVYSNSIIGMVMGRHTSGSDPVDGVFIRRVDGSTAFWIFTRVSDGYGFSALYDQSNNIIFSDDGNSSVGIARPWIPLTWADTGELTAPPTRRQATGTTDTVVQSTIVPQQHSHMELYGYIWVATAGATAEVKLKNLSNGTTVTSITAPDGYVQLSGPVGSYTFGDWNQYDITIRRASGTGNVGFTTVALVGRQSP